MPRNIWTFLLINLTILPSAFTYRFLGLFPCPIKSHLFVYEKLMLALAEKGHDVHVVSHFPQFIQHPRYHTLNVSNMNESLSLSIEDAYNMKIWKVAIYVLIKYRKALCDSIMKYPEIEKLTKSQVKYDAIIMEVYGSDCLIGFAHLLNSSIIGITSTMSLPWANDRIGIPDIPSYIPNYFISTTGSLGILERIELVIVGYLSRIAYYFLSTIPSEIEAKRVFGRSMPLINHLVYNTSLLLTNTHFLLNGLRLKTSRVLEIGGMHITKPKHLPKDLLPKVESNNKGVIYFSMGTVVDMSTFPQEKLKVIVNGLAELPYTVLWKGSSENFPEKLPPNFVVRDWLPQLDVLCHPNTKLFITHGGQLSALECLYCGVPILGIPQFPDHDLNILSFEKHGAGMRLEYSSINQENIRNSLKVLLNNGTYKNNAVRLSAIFKDRPANILDSAGSRVEYVIRNKDTLHLRNAPKEWFFTELCLIDVGILFTVLGYGIATLLAYLILVMQDYLDSRNISSIVLV